jgi:hypothetical protein
MIVTNTQTKHTTTTNIAVCNGSDTIIKTKMKNNKKNSRPTMQYSTMAAAT